jgi:hypothetical protein
MFTNIDNPQAYSELLRKLLNTITKYIDILNNDNINEILYVTLTGIIRICNSDINNSKSDDFINCISGTYNKINEILLTSKNLTHIDNNIVPLLCNYEKLLNEKILEELITSEKIKPSLDLLLLFLSNSNLHLNYKNNIPMIHKILEHKVIPTHECFDLIIENRLISSKTKEELITYMVNFGLTLYFSDVKKLIENYVDIDIKKFDIILDDELINLCLKNQFYHSYLDNIKISEAQLHYLFTLNNLKINKIKSFIEKHELKCDITCLQNACNVHDNIDTIEFLIKDQHINPDKTCLINIKSNNNFKYIYGLVIDSFIKN